ncbi:hypothetical protein ACF0H5_013466 [Mactra antiquata]
MMFTLYLLTAIKVLVMAKQLKNVLVVGISGTTNSGKSTLAYKLLKHLPGCVSFGQDAYFLEPGDPRLDCLHDSDANDYNWEDYRALEMDKMVYDVRQEIQEKQENNSKKCSVIIVEGFSILGWKPLSNLCDLKYFITIDRETCHDRRKTRVYNPPDTPGYFEKIVWPMYVQHLEDIKSQEDIVYLDGLKSSDENLNRILSDIEMCVKEKTDIE